MSNLVIPQTKSTSQFEFTKHFATAFATDSSYKKSVYQILSCFAFQPLILRNKQKAAFLKSPAIPNIALEAKRILRNDVYLISIGGCDYFTFYATYPNATDPQQEEYVAIVIGNLTTVLQDIYNLGGRKFAFQNVGSLGCLPAMRQTFGVTEGCVEGLLSLANLHNTALANVLKELESQLSGFKYSIFNYYDASEDRYLNPTTYGFTNGSDGCCGTGPYRGVDCAIELFELCEDPGEYVWFDGGHSTERANFQYAKLIWSGTPNTTGPYNVQQLFQQV